jgi:hypothetical protein
MQLLTSSYFQWQLAVAVGSFYVNVISEIVAVAVF